MSSVGRNEPCPCGSGFKFKRCCLKKEQPRGAYMSGERDSAVEKLMRFAARSEFKDKHRAAPELSRIESLTLAPYECDCFE